MTRIALTIVVPLILPTVAYWLWLGATGRFAVGGPAALPWPWLLSAGVVLTALTLFVVTVHYGNSPQGTYVPPHVEDGKMVPGRVVPSANP